MIPISAIALLCGMISAVIAEKKGQPVFIGFLAGFLLGPIGIIIMACQAKLPDCPACGTRLKVRGAWICPACHRDIRNPANFRRATLPVR